MTALLNAQKAMSNAKKESANPYFKSKYADLNSVREAVYPPLWEQGIVILQPIVYRDGKNFVKTMLVHVESGESIESEIEILCKNSSDPQQLGSGITYSRRYALQSIIGIGADDDDGNSASGKIPPQTKKELSDKLLAKIVERIGNGELDLIEKTKATFAIKNYELKAMQDAIANYKINNNIA